MIARVRVCFSVCLYVCMYVYMYLHGKRTRTWMGGFGGDKEGSDLFQFLFVVWVGGVVSVLLYESDRQTRGVVALGSSRALVRMCVEIESVSRGRTGSGGGGFTTGLASIVVTE